MVLIISSVSGIVNFMLLVMPQLYLFWVVWEPLQ